MGDPTLQRVKVYRLNDEGLWDDKGTGHVSVELVEVRLAASVGHTCDAADWPWPQRLCCSVGVHCYCCPVCSRSSDSRL